MSDKQIFLYWDEYDTDQSGSIESDVDKNNLNNDKNKRNNA